MKVFHISIIVVLFFANISFGETVYFLVADEGRTESYVLPLTDSGDISHARDLVQYGRGIGEAIVVAHVACGGDGINRDYVSPTKHLWNWHITEFVNFADNTIEILDGRPSDLLRDCQWWMTNTGGSIGFWTFTVVDELGADPKHWQCNFAQDGIINMKDLTVLAQYWLRNDCSSPDWCNGTDLNQNNIVDLTEFDICLSAWLSPYAQSPMWFDAWNCPTQCHGNADCESEGVPFKYPVYTKDLQLLTSLWSCMSWPVIPCGDMCYNPQVDFDRDCDIDEDDVAILEHWTGVRESQFPTDCPITP